MAIVIQGGLFRCCVATATEDKEEHKEGDILNCKYCNGKMIFRDGAFKWDRKSTSRTTPT